MQARIQGSQGGDLNSSLSRGGSAFDENPSSVGRNSKLTTPRKKRNFLLENKLKQ